MNRRSAPTLGILGAGYMGLATGLAFAYHGRRVWAFDINPRVTRSLRRRTSPYREAGLNELLRSEMAGGRFRVAGSLAELVRRSEVIFVCLPTPRGTGGRIELAPMKAGLRSLAGELKRIRPYRLVVVKSTVVPGTTSETLEPLLRRETGKGPRALGVAANPEFLAEGTMVRDAVAPERIVLGVSDRRARSQLRAVYAPFRAPVLELPPSGAELVKYASNAFLAIKVSFANEIGRLTERLGQNVDAVMAAVGTDSRIGKKFLRAGPGFGGSCFDKDVRALVARAKELGEAVRTAESALRSNDEQVDHVLRLIGRAVGPLRGKKVALLGVSFKAGTDDVRESRALPIVRRLRDAGARVWLTDPVALQNFAHEWTRGGWGKSKEIRLARAPRAALEDAHAAILQADWPEFRAWRPSWTKVMREPTLIDLRRSVPPAVARRAGVHLVALGVGRPSRPTSVPGPGLGPRPSRRR